MFLRGIWFVIKITFTSFGGGAATMPVIEQEAIKNGWTTKKEFEKVMIITNSIPGPSMIEAIFFVLNKQLGLIKAMAAVAFGFLPITLMFVGLYIGFEHLPTKYAYAISFAVLPVVCALVTSIGWRFYKGSIAGIGGILAFILTIASAAFCAFVPSPWNVPAILIVIAILYGWISTRKIKVGDK